MIAAGHAYGRFRACVSKARRGRATSFAGAAAAGSAGLGSDVLEPGDHHNESRASRARRSLTIVSPYSKITQGARFERRIPARLSRTAAISRKTQFLPAGYGSWQVNDRLYGSASPDSTPFGLATKPDPSWAGPCLRRFDKGRVIRGLADHRLIKINDMISPSAPGVQIMYINVRYMTAFPQLGGRYNARRVGLVLGIEGDSFGVGFTLRRRRSRPMVRNRNRPWVSVRPYEEGLDGKLHGGVGLGAGNLCALAVALSGRSGTGGGRCRCSLQSSREGERRPA